jgi:hypothetical protein
VKCTPDERPNIFIRNKPIISPQMILRIYKDYYRKSAVGLVVGLKGLEVKTK